MSVRTVHAVLRMSVDDVIRWHEVRGHGLACLGQILLSIPLFVLSETSGYHLCPVPPVDRMTDVDVTGLFHRGHLCFHKVNSSSSMRGRLVVAHVVFVVVPIHHAKAESLSLCFSFWSHFLFSASSEVHREQAESHQSQEWVSSSSGGHQQLRLQILHPRFVRPHRCKLCFFNDKGKFIRQGRVHFSRCRNTMRQGGICCLISLVSLSLTLQQPPGWAPPEGPLVPSY